MQSAGETNPQVGVRFPFHATIKRTVLVSTDHVDMGLVLEEWTCSTIDSHVRRSSRPRPRSIRGYARVRNSSSTARSHRYAPEWTSSRGEWPVSSGKLASSYVNETALGGKCGKWEAV